YPGLFLSSGDSGWDLLFAFPQDATRISAAEGLRGGGGGAGGGSFAPAAAPPPPRSPSAAEMRVASCGKANSRSQPLSPLLRNNPG
ncbi:MAG: hypothetical protein K0M48_08760, partial [Thiobacillus sp.]|nr:hypothetical protein [Thiobacillus sp.]